MTRSSIKFRSNCGSGVPLFALGLIAGGAAVYHKNPLCGALGLVLLAVPAIVFFLLRRTVRQVRVTSVVPESVFEGESVEVNVHLHNGSRLPVFLPQVSEIFSPEVHAQKDVLFPFRVLPGEEVERSYKANCVLPRGIYSVGPIAVSVSDPFGWFQLRKVIIKRQPIKVYPKFEEFGVGEKLGECLTLILESITRFGRGESNEFFSVREYRIGDPLRRVHWGLTAHRGYPVVREYAPNTVGDLCIFLDLFRYAFLGTGRGSSLEQSVKIAAALSAHALRLGYRVQLAARGATDVRVPPGTNKSHLMAILDALVAIKPDGRVRLDDLLDQAVRNVLPGATVIFMVSPYLRHSEKFEGHLASLRRNGARVVLVVFDDSTFHSLYELPRADSPIEKYIARAQALGMDAYRVPCGGNLPAIFAAHAGATP